MAGHLTFRRYWAPICITVLFHLPYGSLSTLFEQRIDPRSPVFVPEAFIAVPSLGHRDVTGRQSYKPSDSEDGSRH